MSGLVCDASVLFKLLIPEEGTDTARVLATGYSIATLDLVYAEIGNALWARMQRGEFDAETAESLIEQLLRNTFDVRPVRSLIPRALTLASEMRHPIYDCTYLALAELLQVPLVTADRKFLNALQRLTRGNVDVRALAAFA